jgi:chaperone LolA
LKVQLPAMRARTPDGVSPTTRTLIACLLCAVMSLAFLSEEKTARASSVDENITRIQKAYEGVRDLKGSFSQTSIIKDLGKTEHYKGYFFIKPPLKMKWSYAGGTAQDLIINGDRVLIYKRAENQAYKAVFNRATYGQTPVALLSGFGTIRDEFTLSGKGDRVVLKPKHQMGTVVSIEIAVAETGFPIRSFVITDSHANVIEIGLTDVKLNTGLKDSLFDLTVPPGVSVFDQGL